MERELTRKGYQVVPCENADFLVSWFGKVNEKVRHQDIDHFYRSYGYGTLSATQPVAAERGSVAKIMSEGTLMVDIVDGQDRQVIWRGSATDSVRQGMSEIEVAAYIERSVKKLLSEFPTR